MKSPFYFIAKPVNGRRYDNIKSISGIDFITSSSEEDHKAANRYAEVIELPIGYNGPVKTGAILLVHHNVFKLYNDIKGRRRSGKSFFHDDTFFIEPDQFFMFFQDGCWQAYDRYCFVKPIPVVKEYLNKNVSEEPLMGEMYLPNEYLLSEGIKRGTKVCFKPESEYEFMVDGIKLYRMFDHQIVIKL